MKKLIAIMLIASTMLILGSCMDSYVDSDTGNMDTDALALDALDKALPDIIENISEEQLLTILEDDRCYTILEDRIIEKLSESDIAYKEFIDTEQIEEYLTYAYGDSDRARDDVANMYPMYGSEIIENARRGY